MEQLGWQTTGRKGTVNGAEYVKKAERFTKAPDSDLRRRDRALAGLDRVLDLGSDAERRSVGAELIEAIRATRAEQAGRSRCGWFSTAVRWHEPVDESPPFR